MDKIKLFCFPYAGGSATVFNRWKQYGGKYIDLIPLELAGRGKRVYEPYYSRMDDLVEDMFRLLTPELECSGSYALFGHSLGGLLAFELGQKIRKTQLKQPIQLFISGHSAPHIKRPDEKKYHLMDGEQFKKEMRTLGGTPPEFFEHHELMELFLPLLKNDFRIAEEVSDHSSIIPLELNLTIFLGKDDDLTQDQCDGWKLHTKRRCSIHYFEGGHFFLHDEAPTIMRLIEHDLMMEQSSGALHSDS